MTDIVERLRENARLKSGEAWRRQDGGQDLCIGAMLADEAADKIERLRTALEFYANSSNWKKERTASQGLGGPEILFDNGEIARNALKD